MSCRNHRAALAILVSASCAHGADVFIGPAFPPTGSPAFAFSGSGLLGAAGGRTLNYSGFDSAAYVSLYWGPSNVDAVKMSLNSNSATMVLPLTSMTATNATFSHSSVAYTSPGGPGAPPSGNYTGRATLDLTGANWVAPPVGVATSAVVDLTGKTSFSAVGQWMSNATGSFTAINTLPTSSGVASSFSGGFFYVPRMEWTGGSGNWDLLSQWNHTSIAPYQSSPVTINRPTPITINGPAAATTVKSLTIGGGGANSNLLILGTGPLAATEGFTVASQGSINGAGALIGSVDVLAGGTLGVLGPLGIDGTLTSAGRLAYRVSTRDETITVSGEANISGLVELKADFSEAAYGTTFPLLSAASLAGTFSTVNNIEISPTHYFAITYSRTEVSAVVARPGNANLDGIVNFADLVLLAQNYNGVGRIWAQGDFNGDGVTNFGDLVLLAQNYNSPATFTADFALAQTMVIPEPIALSALSGLILIAGRRRR